MDATEFLVVKSKQNCEIANYAATKKYFDVAVSRHYYSIYQRILVVLISNVSSYILGKNEGNGASHEFAFSEYRKYALKKCKKRLDSSDVTEVAHLDSMLRDIKRHRVNCDYAQRLINESEYEEDFMKKLKKADAILSKIEPILIERG